MKSILPLVTITMLATVALVGCGSSNSADQQATNAIPTYSNDMNSMHGVTTNLPATNALPDMKTNAPVLSTNMVLGVN